MELVRVAFALIPGKPLFDAVISASQGITDEFYYNANVIDSKTFPPHLSLHICTIPRPALGEVTSALEQLAADALPEITPAGVEPAGGGYVMLNIERSPALLTLHEAILHIAARARESLDADPFGSQYIRGSFMPHISLAKLDRDDQPEAATIGRQVLAGSTSATPQALELCDIGENSEQWKTLASFAPTTPRASTPPSHR